MFTRLTHLSQHFPCGVEVAKQNIMKPSHLGQGTNILSAQHVVLALVSPAPVFTCEVSSDKSTHQPAIGHSCPITPPKRTSDLKSVKSVTFIISFSKDTNIKLEERWGNSEGGGTQAASGLRVLGRPKWGLEGGKVKRQPSLTLLALTIVIPSYPWYQSILNVTFYTWVKSWID